MPLYVLKIRYDGIPFRGSQVQGDSPTVQKALNQALETLARQPIQTLAASRTDTGVHARENYFQVNLPAAIPDSFPYNLNAMLPSAISVDEIWVPTGPDFHARFDALSRRYRYRLYEKKNPFLYQRAYYYPFQLDEDLLDQAAAILPEYRHFSCFAKRNSQTKTDLCQIMKSAWTREQGELVYEIQSNRFLRGMVRAVVGTQLRVGRGQLSLEAFRDILASGSSQNADFSPPGHGLYLEEISYPSGLLEPWEPGKSAAVASRRIENDR